MARSRQLAPLPFDEQILLVLHIMGFFQPLQSEALRGELGLPTTPGAMKPLSIANFLEYREKKGLEGHSLLSTIRVITRKMVAEGFLEPAGGAGYHVCFWTSKEFTARQSKGILFLGTVLGPEFLARQIREAIAHITGRDGNGDIGGGTGILIADDVVLTCKHVVEDMQIDDSVEISGATYHVLSSESHPTLDVAVIYLADKVSHFPEDIAFRSSQLLEGVIIAGYPVVPYGAKTYLTFQTGEICAQSVETMQNLTVDLFTAIARPGNSGGPVLALDGRILGIVTQSLEHDAPRFQVPFFAAVPSEIIRQAVHELSGGKISLPFEDYD